MHGNNLDKSNQEKTLKPKPINFKNRGDNFKKKMNFKKNPTPKDGKNKPYCYVLRKPRDLDLA